MFKSNSLFPFVIINCLSVELCLSRKINRIYKIILGNDSYQLKYKRIEYNISYTHQSFTNYCLVHRIYKEKYLVYASQERNKIKIVIFITVFNYLIIETIIHILLYNKK